MDSMTIKPVKETKFLGVILDNELTWNSHVKSILTKMKCNFGLMCRGKILLPLTVVIIRVLCTNLHDLYLNLYYWILIRHTAPSIQNQA